MEPISFPQGSRILLIRSQSLISDEEHHKIRDILVNNYKLEEINELKEVLPFNQSELDGIVSILTLQDQHKLFLEFLRVLKPSSKVCFFTHLNEEQKKELDSSLLLKGFVDISITFISQDSSNTERLSKVLFAKPKWEIGASASLKSKPLQKPAPTEQKTWQISDQDDDDIQPLASTQQNGSSKKVWKLQLDEEEGDELDEDSLLTAEDLKRPEGARGEGDCERDKSGKARACKNCTCGRAEGKVSTPSQDEHKSSCGSCYLGDAFRCVSCPYRGLPPFKPGEKIVLQTE